MTTLAYGLLFYHMASFLYRTSSIIHNFHTQVWFPAPLQTPLASVSCMDQDKAHYQNRKLNLMIQISQP